MKQLFELVAQYGAKDIAACVDFVTNMPLYLRETTKYWVEKKGTTLHVFGLDKGIGANGYDASHIRSRLDDLPNPLGRLIKIQPYAGIDKIILHEDMYQGKIPHLPKKGYAKAPTVSSESREPSESSPVVVSIKKVSSSESRVDASESRQQVKYVKTPKNTSSESRNTSSESRN